MPKLNCFFFAIFLTTLFSAFETNFSYAASTNNHAPKPNVIIFYTDDQGTLDTNCYGSKDLYTPHIDRLAKEGVMFTQAYAHTVCCPSRAMLLTGRYPQRSSVNHWTQGNMKSAKGINMKLSEITIAEALKTAGYKTALFGKWHLGAAKTHGPTKQGFDEFFGHRGGFIDNFNHHFLHGKGFHDLYDGTTEVFQKGKYFPDLMTHKVLTYLDKNQSNPFFLYVAFNIPHYPEQADAKFNKRYQNLPMPRKSYAKMISTVDDRIGQILNHLDKLKLAKNTIVIFMSDNGHSAEDGGRIRYDDHASQLPKGHYYHAHGGGGNTGKWRGHKGTFYEGGLRVPAIIRYPNIIPANIKRDQAITACDWLPTILDLCKVKLPANKLDGETLLPIIQSNAPTHHKIMHWQWHVQWAVREGDWKLIGHDKNKNVQLLNLSDAQPERKNYAKEKPKLVAHLKQLHNNWATDVFNK